ncbi:MAG: phosphohistidine phosphatase SixA [Desulfovibrionaceae bacterium]
MEILLMQHGVSLSRELNPERPLSPVGKEQAGRTGKLLQSLGLQFAAILTSPKARAVETAMIVAEAVGFPPQRITASDAFKPKTMPQDSADMLRAYEGPNRVLVAGHLPNLAELASHLLTRGPSLSIVFENTGLVCLEVKSTAARNAALLYHLTPRHIQMLTR